MTAAAKTDTRALIVIDVQTGFCPGGNLAVPGGDEIVPGINALMADFHHVILTQDWHPAGHSSFATGLEGLLRALNITDLTLVGLATDFCVNFSALDAARLGFDVAVREDLSRAIDLDGSLAAARTAMEKAGVALIS